MSKDLLVNGKAVPASTKSTLVIEEFLMEYYRFRQNSGMHVFEIVFHFITH